MIKEIKIPDIAENVETGLIANILVSENDEVSVDQPLVEVETDKATTDIPSDYDGVVKEIKVKEGDEVKVNQVIIILEVQDDKEDSNEEEKKKESDDTSSEENDTDDTEPEENDTKKEENDTGDTSSEENDTDDKASEEKGTKKENDLAEKKKEDTNEHDEDESPNDNQIPISPLARKKAREHKVDLSKVNATGPGSRISREDVENFIKDNNQESQLDKSKDKNKSTTSDDSNVERLNNVGRITAETMSEAWQNIPHVTQFDEANITELENFRNEYGKKIEKQGGKLTVTAILLKITAFALQKFPRFNSSLDWENKEIIYKHFYNLGVAVDTPYGLLVPVIRDVNRKSLVELSIELTELAKKARDKKLSPDEMKGGTFTISNLGGIGGTGFTPIVYPPQVAIIGVSRAKYQQTFIKDKDEFQKQLIIPVSLSYDHRVINGADGARFLKYICEVMENPYALLF